MEKQLKSEQVYNGTLLKVYKDDVVLDDNRKSTREYIKHPGGVCILPIINGKVLLEKQFRYPYKEEILELPAGKIELGEDPLAAAKRELEEETGFNAKDLVFVGKMYPTVAYTNEVINLFIATQFDKGKVHFDSDENLVTQLYDINEVIEMVRNNTIKDAKTICLIYKYLDMKRK